MAGPFNNPMSPLYGQGNGPGLGANLSRIPQDLRAARDYLTTVPGAPANPNTAPAGISLASQRNLPASQMDLPTEQVGQVAPNATRAVAGIGAMANPQPSGSPAPQVRTPLAPPQQTSQNGGTSSTLSFAGAREFAAANPADLAPNAVAAGQQLRVGTPRLDPGQGIGQPTGNFYTGTAGQGIEQQAGFRDSILQQQQSLYNRFNQVMDQMANGGEQTTAERMSLGRMASAMATALGQSTQAGTSNFSTDINADNRLGVAGIGANASITQTAADNASRQAIADLGGQIEMAGGFQDGNFGLIGEMLQSQDRNNAYTAQVSSALAGNQPDLLDQAQYQLIQHAINNNDIPTANALAVDANPQVNQYVMGLDGTPILQQNRGRGTGYGYGVLDPYSQEALLQQRLNQQRQ